MGSQKPKAGRQVSQAVHAIRILLRPQNRGLVLAAVVAASAIAGWVYAWQRWGNSASSPAEFVLTESQVFVTPPPAWIHSDVKGEVMRTAGMTQLDLRHPKLVEEIAAAFALHPWVAKVVRVQKRAPARLDVDLEYRRPVAAVEVTSKSEPGLLFVDAQGVLLPSADFASVQAKEFLRVAAGNETPAGVYGTPWGSERITGAALIAAAWEDADGQSTGNRNAANAPKLWQRLKLYRIVAVQSAGGDLIYELRTQAGARVIWGAAPSDEDSSEPSPHQKIAVLERHVEDKGSLDREGAPPLLDIRDLAAPPGSAELSTRNDNRNSDNR